jgi:hypothetical protein
VVVISVFSLLLALTVKLVRYRIMKHEHAAWSAGTVRAGIRERGIPRETAESSDTSATTTRSPAAVDRGPRSLIIRSSHHNTEGFECTMRELSRRCVRSSRGSALKKCGRRTKWTQSSRTRRERHSLS